MIYFSNHKYLHIYRNYLAAVDVYLWRG